MIEIMDHMIDILDPNFGKDRVLVLPLIFGLSKGTVVQFKGCLKWTTRFFPCTENHLYIFIFLTLSLSQNFGSIIWIMGSIIWIIFISARHRKYFESKFWTSTKHAALGAQHDIWVVCR